MITETKPGCPYPRALASALVETANNILYFARHLPRLTDLSGKGRDLSEQVKLLLEFFTFGLIHSSILADVKRQASAS